MTEAEKEFQKADIENAKKRAVELQMFVAEYKNALYRVETAKEILKSVIESAKDKGFTKEILNAVLTSQQIFGVDKIALMNTISEQEKGEE